MTETPDPGQAPRGRGLSRRALLARGGMVTAGAIGAAGAMAAGASPAQAASGGVVIDVINTGAGSTQLTSTAGAEAVTGSGASIATLVLANTASPPVAAPLSLVPVPASTLVGTPAGVVAGDIYTVTDTAGFTDAYLVHEDQSATVQAGAGRVLTDFNSVQVVPIQPVRMLDSRQQMAGASGPGQSNVIVGATSPFNAAGSLIPGQQVVLDLGSLATVATGFVGNVTVTNTTQPGFVTVFPSGTQPQTSTINFAKGWTIANGFLVGAGLSGTSPIITITASSPVAVIIDITAVVTYSADLVTARLAAALAPSAQVRAVHAAVIAARRAAATGG